MITYDEQTLSDAQVFVAVVRCGNFANAARSLNLSQSVCSRSVARLEKRLGVRVLDRTTRAVSLTDEGRRLFERLQPVLYAFEEAFTSVVEGRSHVRGKLRVKMHPTLAHLIDSEKLKSFLEQFSELSLELINDDKLGDLVGEGIDIALHVGDLPSSRLIAKRLLDTRVITVAAPAYLERHEPIRQPKDLLKSEHSIIDYRNPETGRPFQWEFHRGRTIVKIDTPARLVVSDVITMHRICVAGWGIAQVLDVGVRSMLASGSLVQLLTPWSDERFPIHAVYPSRAHVPPKVKFFLDFIAAAVAGESQA